jgi:polyphenol oxidase
MIIRPTIFQKFKTISAGQSTRLGGVSKAPYLSLNLGKSVGDNPQNVDKNREIFFEQLGFKSENAVFSYQIHGNEILKVTEAGNYTGFDAQITNIPGICLAVSIADCTPILIYDADKKAIAAIHAGWRGTVGNIVAKTLSALNIHYGTIGKNCYVFIGACISLDQFEVGDEVAENFDKAFKYFNNNKNKYFVDLKAANKALLVEFGIPEAQIEVTDYCTVTNNNLFFSHRKENGMTGRMLAGIGMRAMN